MKFGRVFTYFRKYKAIKSIYRAGGLLTATENKARKASSLGTAWKAARCDVYSAAFVGDSLNARSFSALRELGGLKSLTLFECTLTDAMCRQFAAMHSLERLVTISVSLTDYGLSGIADLPSLYELSLFGSPISSFGLFALNCSKIRSINLAQTCVGDDAGTALAQWTDLHSVDVSGTQFGNSGLIKLAENKSLKNIFVANSNVSDDAVMEFVRLRPDCKVSVTPIAFSCSRVERSVNPDD